MTFNPLPGAAGLAREASTLAASRFVPLYVGEERIGWVRTDHARRLEAWPEIFHRDGERLTLAASLGDADSRSAAVASVVRSLARQGVITGWRDELYAVSTRFEAPPLLRVERAAARFFGLTSYSVHVNGYVGDGASCRMWLARRSKTKPIDPGMLDNLVGGGLAAGVSIEATLVKEGREEAGIPAGIMAQAVRAGTVRILREVPEGAQSEDIFVFRLKLHEDFQPRNEDGEVAEFRLCGLSEVRELLQRGAEMTLEARLTALEFLKGIKA